MASGKREEEDKLYVCLSHTNYGPVLYSIYEITVAKPIAPPPTKIEANPILQLKSIEYPENMCCVQLGSKFYLFGGKYPEIDGPSSVDRTVDRKYQHVKRFAYPLDLYIFDPTSKGKNKKLINNGTPMNTGKAYPLAFVIDDKIYVLGSTFEYPDRTHFDIVYDKKPHRRPYIKNDIETHVLFEVYDPLVDKWTALPNQPPIRGREAEWCWHSIVGTKLLLVAREFASHCLYCFDFDTNQWANYRKRPSFSRLSFYGGTEFVDGTLYGCQQTTVAAIKDPLAEEGTLYYPSNETEMAMDAIYRNLPPLVDSSISSRLLHLGNGIFCFLVSGNPELHSDDDNFSCMHYYPVADDKKRFISIVIFQTLGETYGVKNKGHEFARGLFSAKFMYSAHCVINTRFPNEGEIKGLFFIRTAGSKLVGKRECIDHPRAHGWSWGGPGGDGDDAEVGRRQRRTIRRQDR